MCLRGRLLSAVSLTPLELHPCVFGSSSFDSFLAGVNGFSFVLKHLPEDKTNEKKNPCWRTVVEAGFVGKPICNEDLNLPKHRWKDLQLLEIPQSAICLLVC